MKSYYKKVIVIICFITKIAAKTEPPYLIQESTWAEKTLKTLTLREKIGQLFIVAAASNFEQPTEALATLMRNCPYQMDQAHIEKMITDYHVGGVIFLFKSDPYTQMKFTEIYKSKAKIPLIIALDSEWGLSMRLDLDPNKVVRYPRNMTLGAIQDEQLIYQLGYEIGKQCVAIGVHMNFAPVADVNNNPENPVIHDRSFGDKPERVARLAGLFARGLQDAGVIACAKHFPGHGDTAVDSHLDLPVIKHNKERLNTIEMYPFKKLIDAGIGAIMNAHLAIPTLDATPNKPSSMSYTIVTDELKTKLGFNGLVITDGLGMEAITKHYKPGELELQAFLAGNDILLCPLDVPQAVTFIENALKNGQISHEELDRRVLKILKAKEWVFAQQEKVKRDINRAYLTRTEAYEFQKKLYQQAVTIAKNRLIEFSNSQLMTNCAVIQIGNLPEQALKKMCEQHMSKMCLYSSKLSDNELEMCLQDLKNYDSVIIAVSDMNKFANQKFGIADNTLKLIDQLKIRGKTVTVVIFGTPYCIKYLNLADTILVAYEDTVPAQETVANILFGKFKPLGKLPITTC